MSDEYKLQFSNLTIMFELPAFDSKLKLKDSRDS